MRYTYTIRRFFAAFFLLLFSFCLTPKRFLHDLLANHKDAQTAASSPVKQLTASGFHCHIDELVVVEPFLPDISEIPPLVLPSSPAHFNTPLRATLFLYHSHSGSRGPPADFCS